MSIPTLKRINISSEQELRIWLEKHVYQAEDVMLVTHTKEAHRKYVGVEQVHTALATYGWVAGRRYTLNGDLLGHVITKSGA